MIKVLLQLKMIIHVKLLYNSGERIKKEDNLYFNYKFYNRAVDVS